MRVRWHKNDPFRGLEMEGMDSTKPWREFLLFLLT